MQRGRRNQAENKRSARAPKQEPQGTRRGRTARAVAAHAPVPERSPPPRPLISAAAAPPPRAAARPADDVRAIIELVADACGDPAWAEPLRAATATTGLELYTWADEIEAAALRAGG